MKTIANAIPCAAMILAVVAQAPPSRFNGVFVRLNPDRAYVERIVPAGPALRREAQFPDNPAGKPWTRANISEAVEPSTLPLGLYMRAAVCELADRTQAGVWSPNLEAVLYLEAPVPSAIPFPAGGSRFGRRPGGPPPGR